MADPESIVYGKSGREQTAQNAEPSQVYPSKSWKRLQRLAGRAHEITQHGDIRAVGPDAPGVDRQAQAFRLIQVYASVV